MKTSARVPIRTRLIVALAIAFIPLVALEAITLQGQADLLRARVTKERHALVVSQAHAADNFLEGNVRALQALARAPAIRQPAPTAELNALLREISEENPVWLTVALSGADGLNISGLTTPPGTVNISDRDYFQGAVAGRPAVGSAIFARALNVKSMVIAVPVDLLSGRRAVLSAALSLDSVEQELRRALPTGIELLVIDRRGQEFIGPGQTAGTFPVRLDDPAVQSAMGGGAGAVLREVDGLEHLVAYAPAPEGGWSLILREPATSAFAEIEAQRRAALLLTTIAILIAFGLALFLATRLERTYRDIDRAGELVEAERRRLSEVVDELPVPVAMYDADGRAVLRNAAYFQLLGGQPPERITDAVRYYDTRREDGSSIPREDLPQLRALRGEVVRAEPLRLRHGETREDIHLLVDAVPLSPGGGAPLALVVMHDVTDLRRIERERTAFFEMASHEIKTPLTALVGHVELARRWAKRGERDRLDEILARADEGGRRLADLVRDLLDLSRLDAGRLDLRRERVDLGALVESVLEETRLTLERHTVRYAGPTEPLALQADPRRLTQILQNLLSNAVRYSPDGGTIDVSVEASGDEALVRVTDRGVGIPEDERAQLFQRFFRTSRTQATSGTGLGLFISRQIAQAHGGRLWLEESGPDSTTFALALPLVP